MNQIWGKENSKEGIYLEEILERKNSWNDKRMSQKLLKFLQCRHIKKFKVIVTFWSHEIEYINFYSKLTFYPILI